MTFGMIYINNVITSRRANFTGLYGRYEALKSFHGDIRIVKHCKDGDWMDEYSGA